MLVGRNAELAALEAAIVTVRDGLSAVLVVRREAGTGKTALVDHAVASANDVEMLRVTGIESEIELPYAALHRLLLRFIPRMESLPKPQHLALATLFGIAQGATPNRFLVGLATLTLFDRIGMFFCVPLGFQLGGFDGEFGQSSSPNSPSCSGRRPRMSSHSTMASVTPADVSSGTGTEIPRSLRICRCLAMRTSSTLPSMPLSLP